jgi:prepilin-type N-terminal cleavage/methylation domain-containing protein
MFKPHPIRRAGMTLVELLVVVAIIGLLAVTVLPNVATTTENRRSREAARVTSSFFAKAQSRAIGRPEWAGVTVVPTNNSVSYAIDLFQANVPQVYRGETYTASATIASSDIGTTRLLNLSDGGFPPARNVTNGDLIRFDGGGPWYELTAGGSRFQMRGEGAGATELSGQSSTNTPWPAAEVQHPFEILRQPVRNGSAFTIPDGRCIDLGWSGYGSRTDYKYLGGEDVNRNGIMEADEDKNNNKKLDLLPFAPVSVLFDATGRLRQIVKSAERVSATGPVFFLVGRVDRANNDPTLPSTFDGNDDTKGFNWQYGDSYWIVIDPASGIVKTAECLPKQATVVDSQNLARLETPTGGM